MNDKAVAFYWKRRQLGLNTQGMAFSGDRIVQWPEDEPRPSDADLDAWEVEFLADQEAARAEPTIDQVLLEIARDKLSITSEEIEQKREELRQSR
jgi:hypothetical protein